MKTSNLRCEYLVNPLGLDAKSPRLSWILEVGDAARRGVRQTAYRICVAKSLDALEEGIYVVEFKLGTAADALAQIKARRYYEPYRTDPRPIILLGAGGFADRAVQCLWEALAG